MDLKTLNIAGVDYRVASLLPENPYDPALWVQLEKDGKWDFSSKSITGEWLRNSPSLFWHRKIEGDYLFQIRATRLEPDFQFINRFKASKHGKDKDPAKMYNFNFWLRGDSPDGKPFFEEYPKKLGTGWNGMGDDYWHSLYNTVVWGEDNHNWVRLRKGPGYEKIMEAKDIVPFFAYGDSGTFSIVVRKDGILAFFNEKQVYSCQQKRIYNSGYIGFCVWLCRMRFDELGLYRIINDGEREPPLNLPLFKGEKEKE